jgi:hypothetical protein
MFSMYTLSHAYAAPPENAKRCDTQSGNVADLTTFEKNNECVDAGEA